MLAVRALFDRLGLWQILDDALPRAKNGPSHTNRVFVLLANRLIRPTSEHGLARWLDTDFVCDRLGRRFVPNWHQNRRVQVHSKQLGFRRMKDVLSLRPVYHQVEPRVKAHVFVATLGLLLQTLLEDRLKAAKVDLSAEHALHALETVRHVSFNVDGETRTGVSLKNPRARQVLNSLGVTTYRPPLPPTGEETVM